MAPPDPADPLPPEEFFCIEPGRGTVTRLELADRLRNPWGILHGGAVAMLADVAACRAVVAGQEDGRGRPVAAADTVLHYLRPVKVGPVEARCQVLGGRPGSDAGPGGRPRHRRRRPPDHGGHRQPSWMSLNHARLRGCHRSMPAGSPEPIVRTQPMIGRTVVITGGNSGVGKATAVALASLGARTVITARSESRGAEAVADIRRSSGSDQVELVVFDLADLSSVRAGGDGVARALSERSTCWSTTPDWSCPSRSETMDGFEATFAINHLGPFSLTEILLDRLIASAPARVVNVASTAHRSARDGVGFDDLQSERQYRGMQVYGRSKLANILFTNELARRLAGPG